MQFQKWRDKTLFKMFILRIIADVIKKNSYVNKRLYYRNIINFINYFFVIYIKVGKISLLEECELLEFKKTALKDLIFNSLSNFKIWK